MPPRGVPALTGLRHLSPMSTWLSLPASRHHSAQALPSTHLLPGRYAQQPLTPHASGPSAFSPTPCLPSFHSNSMECLLHVGTVLVLGTPASKGTPTAFLLPSPRTPGSATPPCHFSSRHLLWNKLSTLFFPTLSLGAQGEHLHQRGWHTGLVTGATLG